MRWFWCSVLLCCVYVTPGLAQLKVSDGKYVTAIIDPNNQGLITIRVRPGTNLDPILSYPQKSFISIMVGDKIFTNNHTGAHIASDSRFGGFLDNGVTQKVGDTLRTTWPNKNGCDIIQDVYAVALEFSGQIVMRWKIKNNSPTNAIWGQGQLLLDIQVGAQNPNDGAPILTQYGYRPIWEKYTSASANGIPWFFAAFENQLPNAPQFTTGITGVGYNEDVNYILGLKKPSQMTVGDWGSPLGTAALVDFLWGVSAAAPWGTTFTDAAMHFQWEGLSIPGGKTMEVASTSYGTGEFGICTGQLFGILFYPRHFEWKTGQYEPITANVEFYAFDVYSPIPQDPNFGPPSSATSIKLHCGPNLRIVDPVTGKTHKQLTQPSNGFIPQYGVGSAKWKIVADKIINCKADLNSWLKFTAESSLSGTGPIFFNSGDGDTCEHPVLIDCQDADRTKPVVESVKRSANAPEIDTFVIHDRTATTDRGIDIINVVAKPGSNTNVAKFTIAVSPPLTPCSKLVHKLTIAQLDSTIGGCFNVTVRDCTGNDSSFSLCITAHPYTPPRDTVPTYVGQIDTAALWSRKIEFSDSAIFDRGIDTLILTPLGTTDKLRFVSTITPPLTKCSKLSHRITIVQADSLASGCFLITIRDCGANMSVSDTICFDPIYPATVDNVTESVTLELIGNPASERTTLRIDASGTHAATIRIVDLTGREVAIQQAALLAGRNDISLSTVALAEGTYYVIADWDGRSYARKLSVIK